jgi:Amt family ammonium transporter
LFPCLDPSDFSLHALIFALKSYLPGLGFEHQKLLAYSNSTIFTLPSDGPQDNSAFWVFQFSFCATAATIVSGAVAERLKLEAYFVYTFFLTGFIYPVVAHWAWQGDGWATHQVISGHSVSVIDFAGSGVVHMVGGAAALVGIYVIGPRMRRFQKQKTDDNFASVNLSENDFSGQSTTFCVLGTFILWVGWYGFNCASTGGIAGNGHLAGHAAMTTTISAATSGCFSFLLSRYVDNHWSPAGAMNGILSGLVAITAGCANVDTYGAFFIGLVAAPLYVAASKALIKLELDDVVDAVPVHLVNGIWGVLAPGFFSSADGACGVFYGDAFYLKPDGQSESDVPYRSCNGAQGAQLGAQFAFVLAILAWVIPLSLLMFTALHKADMLRVSATVEENGLDEYEHGGSAYEQDRKVIRAESFKLETARRASFKLEVGALPGDALPLEGLDLELELGLPAEDSQ